MKLIFFYFTNENGMKRQESLNINYVIENIYSLEAPFIYFLQKQNQNSAKSDSYTISKEILKDFKNIQKQ